jgi:hypothetical protein
MCHSEKEMYIPKRGEELAVYLACTFTFLGAPATTVQTVDWFTKCYFISRMMSKCLKLFVWNKV